ncbi:tRNA guanosine-2-O-methyltransferase TRM13 [Trypanosoma conorhini]|uniref:tRNA:m(4)X modification enzyme TRM13 n=1 Tax=Trypanosoma conorhini TaxID=83891 RepID=A0A3S5IUK9_9TRYP|nr:tRNA guanosine-2-O-methyltransferase TRM13 [Trypanosoma conorhini]RNF26496.1 tRNA guanosine-2-O-methyltransferase TRM13 [Trypanosoma conorhini]
MRRSLRACAHASSRCRQKQYHGTRAAAQLVAPLLTDALDAVSSSSVDARRAALASALVGVPPSLAHEGPLACGHLSALTGLREGELRRVLSATLAEALEAPPTVHVAAMWPPSLQETYVRELLRARAAETRQPFPRRFEAGLTARYVFAGSPVEACVSGCGECATGEGRALEPAQAGRWRQLIDTYTLLLPDRSPLHELENLPQEIGIGELLSSLCSEEQGEVEAIIDVGGGNGFLAAQLAEVLRCEALVVDPFTPKHAIDNDSFPHWGELARQRPRVPRRQPLRRIPRRLTEVDWVATPLDFSRCAMIAKHLCGTAIDTCVRHLRAVERLPRVMVLVPCCFNKGCFADYCNPDYLHRVAGVTTEAAWSRWTRLTDWNRSSYQQAAATHRTPCCGEMAEEQQRHPKRRKKLHHFLPCMDDVASVAEAVINQGRVLRLRELGYHAATVEYVPRCVTPKNRAIVAVRDVKFPPRLHSGV